MSTESTQKAEMTMNRPYMLLMVVSPQGRQIRSGSSSRNRSVCWPYKRAASSEDKQWEDHAGATGEVSAREETPRTLHTLHKTSLPASTPPCPEL